MSLKNEQAVTAEWYGQYVKHCVNNIMDREGKVRFSYMQLRTSLNAINQGRDDIDEGVRELMSKIIGVLPPVNLSDRQIVTLCLVLLNQHMGYHLLNPNLVDFIDG